MNRRDALAVLIGLSGALSFAFDTAAHSEEDRLAIKGYDPVAYFTEAKPMIGDPQYQYELDGALYRFASTRHLDLFKADPDRYLPQYQNWCTAALSRGYRLVADPNNWVIHEGRLYVFGGPAGPGKFAADPAAMVRKAHANYPRLPDLPDWPPQ
ncbi:MAG: hypothetical protein E5Y65_12355 [Mesorhizobium sp.]|jgi:YHS domain-containing protein|nr:YHS domain-containing (seleno)protein [Mesorhizobium sp.]TIL73716.1 MAG: hypothetical protein E5Y70_14975 [Mesorhizobium sp.]TIL91219.1 MAG: hypothetical protein E5Y65_12355 [Mesorhizobium sp.]TIM01217.1 MAG: hypothetical protein E5Y64_13940 [Mesorhizobium sp.]